MQQGTTKGQKSILAARSDARISGYTARPLPMGNCLPVSPGILVRWAHKDRLQEAYDDNATASAMVRLMPVKIGSTSQLSCSA